MDSERLSRRPRWITRWDPEDTRFWDEHGFTVANRNLWASIATEHLGFCVWSLWSVLVLFMTPEAGFALTGGQKFLLVSAVALVGAVLRVPYTLVAPRVGGRTWTMVSVALLFVPTVLAVVLMQRPETPFPVFLALAATAGLGGGNFSSSMTNINYFFPEHHKGLALGLNAGGGNVGVASVQFAGLAVVAVAGTAFGHLLPLLFLPALALGVWVAWRFMDNLAHARTGARARLSAVGERHFWIMSLLYVGAFGSFIGFGFAFGLLLQGEFGRTPLEAASIAFVGPLVGSVIRPLGGWLADRFGGARVTLRAFLGMAVVGALVVPALAAGSVLVFVAVFVAMFALTGICNGSTYKMIPSVYAARAQDLAARGVPAEQARARAEHTSSTLLGMIGAVGALGGVGINMALRESYTRWDTAVPAFAVFVVFYLACALVTWSAYRRRPAHGRPRDRDGAGDRRSAATAG